MKTAGKIALAGLGILTIAAAAPWLAMGGTSIIFNRLKNPFQAEEKRRHPSITHTPDGRLARVVEVMGNQRGSYG